MLKYYGKEIIERAYNEIVAKGIFDIEEGNKPIEVNDQLRYIPEKMYKHINKGGKGCCFVFSAYLMKLLHEQGIASAMVTTTEVTDTRASVLYQDSGQFYVANPVADIEMFTKKDVPSVLRNFIINSQENKYKNSRIPLQEFANEFGQVSYLGDFFSEEKGKITLGQAMEQTTIIATPDYTLEQFIRESKPELYCEKRPELTCIDGYKFSVQASEPHYSFPRIDGLDEYERFEVAGITEDQIWELQEFVEDPNEKYIVYAFVPADKINEVIENHGGLNKKVIQKAIHDLKESYKSQNTELDRRLEQIAGGNEYLLNILKYATRKSRLTQTNQELGNETPENNGGNNDGQK